MKSQFRTSTRYLAIVLVVAAPFASRQAIALSSDKSQIMNVEANTSHSIASKTGAVDDPAITHLDGAVRITRGSIEMRAAHATIYQIPNGANSPNAGKYSHIVLTGTRAHMQQVHDGDCSLMTADARTIDYKPLVHLAELTGDVHVVQAGRGDSHSEHMIYNTDTGEMQAGDGSATSRVIMHMVPKAAIPATPHAANCGFPGAAKDRQAKSTTAKDRH
ncbi:MAG: lipopolysaccharide transport periplasmic protein LptA [Rudaea sp.]